MEYEAGIQLITDANAAVGISNRLGSGKVRHIAVNQLWLQGKLRSKEMTVVKVPTEKNLADALTKGVESETLKHHVQRVGAKIRRDRHEMVPKTEHEESEEMKTL